MEGVISDKTSQYAVKDQEIAKLKNSIMDLENEIKKLREEA